MTKSYRLVEIVVDNLIFLTGCPVDSKVFSYVAQSWMQHTGPGRVQTHNLSIMNPQLKGILPDLK